MVLLSLDIGAYLVFYRFCAKCRDNRETLCLWGLPGAEQTIYCTRLWEKNKRDAVRWPSLSSLASRVLTTNHPEDMVPALSSVSSKVLKNPPHRRHGAYLLFSFFSDTGKSWVTMCYGVCLLPWRLHSSPGHKEFHGQVL